MGAVLLSRCDMNANWNARTAHGMTVIGPPRASGGQFIRCARSPGRMPTPRGLVGHHAVPSRPTGAIPIVCAALHCTTLLLRLPVLFHSPPARAMLSARSRIRVPNCMPAGSSVMRGQAQRHLLGTCLFSLPFGTVLAVDGLVRWCPHCYDRSSSSSSPQS